MRCGGVQANGGVCGVSAPGCRDESAARCWGVVSRGQSGGVSGSRVPGLIAGRKVLRECPACSLPPCLSGPVLDIVALRWELFK